MRVAADAGNAADTDKAANAKENNKRMMRDDTAQTIISVSGLGKQVITASAALTILDGVSFDVRAGESVAVIGVSGSGKSTLLGLLAGLDTPTSGAVRVDGQDLNALDEDGRAALRGRMIGFVFQSFQLLPAMTALENAMLPLELAGADDAEAQAHAMLSRVGLADRVHHYPKQLSGGEQQRVAIARAFVRRPRLLFADEPTGNLDTATGAQVIDLLFELNRESGATLLLVTHDEALTRRCSRVLRLAAGRLENGAR
jgi:putative ABC transport system ATP-binding protein